MNPNVQKSINYILKKTGKQSMHTVPSAYFDSLEDQICTKIVARSFSKEHGFSIPKYYSNTLENKVLQKIVVRRKQPPPLRLKYSLSLAAACLVLFFAIYNPFKTNNLNFNSLADNEIENWLENNADRFLITDDDFSFEDAFLLTSLEETTLEEYLQE